MNMQEKLMMEMIRYYRGDAKRIQHFTKVYSYASLIGKMEGLGGREQYVLELAALVHDIGIKISEEKYGYNNGKLQEQEGPAEAKKLLERLGVDPEDIARICYLVGHHHTYTGIDGADYQILVEADFLVNLYEDGAGKEAEKNAGERVFRTASGKAILHEMYDLTPEK